MNKDQVEISVGLFGKPEWEIGECSLSATPEVLRALGKNLCKRLSRVSDIIEKLDKIYDRSEAYGAYYSLDYFTDDDEKTVKEKLMVLEIKENEVSLNLIPGEDEEIVE